MNAFNFDKASQKPPFPKNTKNPPRPQKVKPHFTHHTPLFTFKIKESDFFLTFKQIPQNLHFNKDTISLDTKSKDS